MYYAEFECYRTLNINCDLVFDIFGKNRDDFISRQGYGYIDGDEQAFKTLSSGNFDIFSLDIIEPLPLVVGTIFIVEKSWTASGEPATYGYGTIIEIIE